MEHDSEFEFFISRILSDGRNNLRTGAGSERDSA